MTFTKILLPFDFSETSSLASSYAVSLARAYRAELLVLHVVDNSLDYSFAYAGMTPYQAPMQDYYEQLRKRSLEMLEELIARETDVTLTARPLVSFGSPHREILTCAEENAIDLIVMGTHGRTGLGHILLGSTAERVVRGAACPVLTVRRGPST